MICCAAADGVTDRIGAVVVVALPCGVSCCGVRCCCLSIDKSGRQYCYYDNYCKD